MAYIWSEIIIKKGTLTIQFNISTFSWVILIFTSTPKHKTFHTALLSGSSFGQLPHDSVPTIKTHTHALTHTLEASVTVAEFSNWLWSAASAKAFGCVGKLSASGICCHHFPGQDGPPRNTWVRTCSASFHSAGTCYIGSSNCSSFS